MILNSLSWMIFVDFCNCWHLFHKFSFFFKLWALFCTHMNFQDHKSILFDIEELTLMFSRNFENVKNRISHFSSFLGSESCAFGFVVSSRALLVRNASFLARLNLGNKYAYRKRIVKLISKLHFSTPKNSRPGRTRTAS